MFSPSGLGQFLVLSSLQAKVLRDCYYKRKQNKIKQKKNTSLAFFFPELTYF